MNKDNDKINIDSEDIIDVEDYTEELRDNNGKFVQGHKKLEEHNKNRIKTEFNDDNRKMAKRSKTQIKKETIATLAAQGLSNKEIGDKMGMSPKTIEKYINTDLEVIQMIEDKVNNIIDEGDKLIRQVYLEQIETLIDIAKNGKSENNRLKAATYIIELLRGKPTSKVEADVNTNALTVIDVNIIDDNPEENPK